MYIFVSTKYMSLKVNNFGLTTFIYYNTETN